VLGVWLILGVVLACGVSCSSSDKPGVSPTPEGGAAGESHTGGSQSAAGTGGRPAGGGGGTVEPNGGAAGEELIAGSGGVAGEAGEAGSGGAAGEQLAAGSGGKGGSAGSAGAAGSGTAAGLGKLSAAWQNTCALKADGSAACWGYNSSRQLGTGSNSDYASPFPLPLPEQVSSVAAGETQTCAVGVSGTLYCSGAVVGTHQAVSGLSAVKSVVVNALQICALRETGHVFCLGNATATPVQVNGALGMALDNVVALAAGRFHNCALFGDGHVSCWGLNTSGQLGNGVVNSAELPNEASAVPVAGLYDVRTVVAGANYTCALVTDGTVRCWGGNGGVFGDGSLTPELFPVPVTVPGLSNVAALAGGESIVCAAATNGTVRCWGFGSMGNGQVNESQPTPKLVAGLNDVGALAAGFQHICALRKDGSLACWGSSQHGQLGLGDLYPRNTPEDLPGGAIWARP